MKETEAGLQKAVIELAHLHDWTVAHFRPAETKKGWRTPVSADGAGFPDLVLARPGYFVMYRELKTNTGRRSKNQIIWATVLLAAGADYGVWRPRDWARIERELA